MNEVMMGSSLQDLEILDWGQMEYGEAFLRQKALVEERIAGSSGDCLEFGAAQELKGINPIGSWL